MNRRSFFKGLALTPLLRFVPKQAEKRSGTKYVGPVPVSHWTVSTSTCAGSTAPLIKTYYFDGDGTVGRSG